MELDAEKNAETDGRPSSATTVTSPIFEDPNATRRLLRKLDLRLMPLLALLYLCVQYCPFLASDLCLGCRLSFLVRSVRYCEPRFCRGWPESHGIERWKCTTGQPRGRPQIDRYAIQGTSARSAGPVVHEKRSSAPFPADCALSSLLQIAVSLYFPCYVAAAWPR